MILAIIPARYASARFPGKPLADLGGKSVVQRVYRRAQASRATAVVVATDDRRILDHVVAFGGQAVLTDPGHPSGTDRVAEVAARYPRAEIVVNVQGDEPFVDPTQIDQLIQAFREPATDIATLARPITEEQELLSPNVVKVVLGSRGHALYFSRHAIPYLRDVPVGRWIDHGRHLQHLGLYAYRAPVLAELTRLPPGELENDERLEQLRWLAAGYSIHVGLTDRTSVGIDTPADLERARALLKD